MKRFVLADRAKMDLEGIADFWDEISVRTSKHILVSIHKQFRMLAANPGLGRARPEYAPVLRSSPVEDYVIFFSMLSRGVMIHRIIHGTRDITSDDFA